MADVILKEDGTKLLLEDGTSKVLLKANIGQKPGAPPIVRKPKLQFRRGTTAEWAANNPVLLAGEPGVNLTTGDFKIGDGTTAWASIAVNYAPWSLTNNPRGIVAITDGFNPAPTINAAGVDLTGSLTYIYDPTRRYRANYIIRAQSPASSVQFQLINAATGALVGSDHIPGSPVATAAGYSGSVFTWLFSANGFLDLRVRTTGFFTSGMIVYSTGGGFYVEDVGAA